MHHQKPSAPLLTTLRGCFDRERTAARSYEATLSAQTEPMAPAVVVLTHVEDPYASHWSCRARAPCAEETFDDHWTLRERPPPVSTPRKTFLAPRAARRPTQGPGQPMRHPGVLALPQDKTLVNLEGNIGAGKSTLLRVLEAAYGGCGAVAFCPTSPSPNGSARACSRRSTRARCRRPRSS